MFSLIVAASLSCDPVSVVQIVRAQASCYGGCNQPQPAPPADPDVIQLQRAAPSYAAPVQVVQAAPVQIVRAAPVYAYAAPAQIVRVQAVRSHSRVAVVRAGGGGAQVVVKANAGGGARKAKAKAKRGRAKAKVKR